MNLPSGKSELLLFHSKPYQVSMENGFWVDYHPINSLKSDGPIEFEISSSNDEYLDLNDTVLYVKFTVVDKVSGTLKDIDVVSPTNLILSSMFQDVILTMNGKVIETANNLYPYKAMMTVALQYSADVAESQFSASGWYPDTPGKMDSISDANIGFKKRKTMSHKVNEVMGPLFLDFFTQSRYLLPNVNLHLRLDRTTDEFALLSTSENFSLKIYDAQLYVRKVKIRESVRLAHEQGLRSMNAIYPIQKTDFRVLNITLGSNSFIQDNLFFGRVPKMIIMAMVRNSAFYGSFNSNPFNFDHFNVSMICLYVNGSPAPGKELRPDFPSGLCVREYMALFQSLEMLGRNETNSITLENYKAGGFVFFAFNLCPDLDMNGGQVNRMGNVRLELKFNKALDDPINVILFSIQDGEIQVTKNREVLVI